MRRPRRLWPAMLPLLIVLGLVAATCGNTAGIGLTGTALANGRSAATDGLRGAVGLGRVSTNSFRRQVTAQAFDGGRATVNVTPTFDGLGMVAVNRHGTLYAIQRRGNSSIDPTGQVAIFEFRGADQGWVSRPIYDSEWDDRNVAGGTTPKGTIVVFLGRYDSQSGRWIDLGFVRSTDDGQTFSKFEPLPVGTDRWFSPYGPLIALPSGRLMQLFYGNDGYSYRLRALFSDDDGATWGHESVIDRQSYERPTEAAGVLIGGATDATSEIVVVSRTEPGPNPKAQGGLFQYSSRDGGTTWKRIGFLHVGSTPSDISPWLTSMSDGRIALVWAARRDMTIQVSMADGQKAVRNRLAWKQPYTLFTSRLANQRPRQAANFGYPSIAHLSNGDDNAVVVFFDANASDPSVFHEKAFANTDLVLIRLLGPRIAERRRLARMRGAHG